MTRWATGYLRRWRRGWQRHPATFAGADIAVPICALLTLAGWFPLIPAVSVALVACTAQLVVLVRDTGSPRG